MYNYLKAQGERNYGKIYIRFPEAVSMREYLGEPHGPMTDDQAAKRLALQKMAIEVAWRILRATPVNATGLVSALLLNTRGVALTLDQIHHTLQDSLDYLQRRQTPVTTSALRLRSLDGVRSALDALSNGHPVTRVDGGREPVWRIAPEDEHAAGFYRNSIIDAFLETSIVELALAYAKRVDGDRLQAFWAQAMRLRDLLKFDFYFADSATFRANIAEEMAWHENWESHVAAGGEEIDTMLHAKRPLMAQAMLRVFFESYEIVADVLCDLPAEVSEKDLTKRALGVGRQYVAQRRVRSPEPVSTLLFATARQVVADQGLLTPADDLAERRTAFLHELRDILSDVDHVEQIASQQFYEREAERAGEHRNPRSRCSPSLGPGSLGDDRLGFVRWHAERCQDMACERLFGVGAVASVEDSRMRANAPPMTAVRRTSISATRGSGPATGRGARPAEELARYEELSGGTPCTISTTTRSSRDAARDHHGPRQAHDDRRRAAATDVALVVGHRGGRLLSTSRDGDPASVPGSYS